MMRAAVIVDPAKADVPAPWEQVDKTLAAAGWSTPLWLETTPEDPGRGMAEAAVAAGVQLVVICGGDGTVMGRLGALVGTDVPVAVVPLGTGNLLAHNLGVPIGFADALAVAVNGVDRRIDLGRVGDQPFAVMAGIGFDAAMMADATEDMKRCRLAGPCGQRPPAPARPSDASAAAHRRQPAAAPAGPHGAGRRRRAAARRAELLPDAAGSGWRGACFAAIARGIRTSNASAAARSWSRPTDRAPADGRRGHRRRSLNARIEPGPLVVRAPLPVATAA